MGNNERALKAKEHHERMIHLYGKQTEDSVRRSRVYEADYDTSAVVLLNNKGDMEVSIEEMTTSEAVFKYAEESKYLGVLNFASYRHAGGGFIKGSFAQEEAICHSSNLYGVLSSERIQEEFYEKNLESLCNNLYTSRLVYSPDIVFVSDNKNIKCDVITCAAPNVGAYRGRDASLDIKGILRERIDHILYSAYENDVKILILGAFGCGVFRNDPYKVAEVFKELLFEKYTSCFKKVVFAIPRGSNLDAFREVFS